jgi:hypothetical protein
LECLFAVMTDAAGLPLFHLGHRIGAFSCHVTVNPGVADRAIVPFKMLFVAERLPAPFLSPSCSTSATL